MIQDLHIKEFLLGFEIIEMPNAWFAEEGNSKEQGLRYSNASQLDSRTELDFEQLKQQAISCRLCKLCDTRKSVVFGDGNSNSPLIAFVGEGPGADEDEAGLPFVGRAGKLLSDAIEKGLGLKRENLYICNVVKCRPPQNRTPSSDEVLACAPYLYRQLELVNPKVIITLGQTAQLALSGSNVGITRLRGQWQKWRDIPLMPTYHPAYILRNPPAKKPFWEDLKSVMKFLGI